MITKRDFIFPAVIFYEKHNLKNCAIQTDNTNGIIPYKRHVRALKIIPFSTDHKIRRDEMLEFNGSTAR